VDEPTEGLADPEAAEIPPEPPPPEGADDAPPVEALPTTPEASFRAPIAPPRSPPASRYASLSAAGCKSELARRGLPFSPSERAAKNVATPLRPSGPLAGVKIVMPRKPSPFGILDCRLALALADVARLAAERGVVEVRIDNAHRPRAKLPTKSRKPSQHAYGLAADVTAFRLADGRVLDVERDWHAPIGATACGPDAVLSDPTPEAIALRDLVCAIARAGLFHHILTPSHDAAHRDHLHLDVQRGAKVMPVR
jgi:hypothetical protein